MAAKNSKAINEPSAINNMVKRHHVSEVRARDHDLDCKEVERTPIAIVTNMLLST